MVIFTVSAWNVGFSIKICLETVPEIVAVSPKMYSDLSVERVTTTLDVCCCTGSLPFEEPAVDVTNFQSDEESVSYPS